MNRRPTFRALRAWLALAVFCLLALGAQAHPVAQGNLTIHLTPGGVDVLAHVSNEEVFVASAFGDKPAADLDAAFQAHGAYLLEKIELRADDQLLAGKLDKVTPSADRSPKGMTAYAWHYALPAGAPPKQLRATQSLLNEIPFAPGNPWEATFVVDFIEGSARRGGGLLTHREPLILTLGVVSGGIFGEYFSHGFHHILEGWDHLLFMAALVLATQKLMELVKVVTAFTLAHTITLVLSVNNWFRLPSQIVEPMIALSIIVVAVQNVWRPAETHGRLRLALAFGFGLFHGLGFAGGLLEAMEGMQGTNLGQALTAFSLGVEVGHQVVVLPIFFGMAIIASCLRQPLTRERFTLAVLRYGSMIIALAGAFYLQAALRA
jgi:hypothetical protein